MRTQFTGRMIINIVKLNVESLINNSGFGCTTLLQCTTKLCVCVYSLVAGMYTNFQFKKAESDSPFGFKIPHLLTEVKSVALHHMT